MRFTENGPDIPHELISAQRNGQVIFFCGAGISVPAELPGFKCLTENVAQKLHATDHDIVKNMIERGEYDRVFSWLRQHYPSDQVDYHILNSLKVPRSPKLENHRNLLKLSKTPLGEPLVVTTNFDRLFERAQEGLKHYTAPFLPDLQMDRDASGIIYLHGRWQKPNLKNPPKYNLVISSQDFGKAYLSHGWAARFLSNILRTRTIVLIGYSGDDTLVRYLLEGLNAETGAAHTNVYAFDCGSEGEVNRKWSSLGVNAIPYPDHSDLWKTIEEWSKLAATPDYWENYIHNIAQSSPRSLLPFQRGQVASFISDQKGAEKFATFNPLPHAEWICVFDRNVRFFKPKSYVPETEDTIDLLDDYGTDRDPSRAELERSSDQNNFLIGDDYVSTLPTHETSKLSERLSNLNYSELWRVNSRITALSHWITKVIDQPETIWWLLKQTTLHPIILDCIASKGFEESDNPPTKLEKFWPLFFYFHKNQSNNCDYEWFKLKQKIDTKGWNSSIIDQLSEITQPELLAKTYRNTDTPINSFEEIETIIPVFEVHFPHLTYMELEVPEAWISATLEVLTQSLKKAIDLSNMVGYPEVSSYNFDFPALTSNKNSVSSHTDNFGKLILLAADLIKRLAHIDAQELSKIVNTWPDSDPNVFDRLKFFAWRFDSIIPASMVAQQLGTMSDEVFRDSSTILELLEMLNIRLSGFSQKDRLKIENWIWAFTDKDEWEDQKRFEERKIYWLGRIFSKIDETSTGLTSLGKTRLNQIKASEHWKDQYLEEEFSSGRIKGGFVSTDTSTHGLEKLGGTELFEEILRRESDHSVFLKENKPFIGLIKADPIKITTELVSELEKGEHRTRFWQQLFSHFPESASTDDIKFVAKAIPILPEEIVYECRYTLTSWIQKQLSKALKNEQKIFWEIWDHVFLQLNNYGPEATTSAIGETRRAGRVVRTSRKTITHALNSPIGHLVEAIFQTIESWSLNPATNDFTAILNRLVLSLNAIGDGSANATTMIALRYNYLFYWFPDWAKEHLVPVFAVEHENAEAAWRGLVNQNKLPVGDAFWSIKSEMIKVLGSQVEWEDEDDFRRGLACIVVAYAYFHGRRKKYLQDYEVRTAIRSFDDESRAHALWQLGRIVEDYDCWTTFGKRFFKRYWPLEREYQSRKTSSQLLMLTSQSGNHFPDIAETIIPFLVPAERGDMFTHSIISETPSIASQWPEVVLRIFDRIYPPSMSTAPYNLRKALDEIAQASADLRVDPTWKRLDEICPVR
ncbi:MULTISPECIES: SIR2 family protein [Thalassospira]|uniref:SIR2-like domain-containing protein n=2 Tax=Thalassospira tepidiphila TaxID=393657 RepID=A0A853KUK1_9PROT|nr:MULTISPECIES: SIR2 family protein [Thalassospira]MBE70574.1 hypothetical protein [Thalassospira sp.]NJB75712.1 hypothetical protein [Thalassospira tepidiphila]OAZ07675.1 hypothetical protein TH4_20795 [Thalassospira tepidiphila MCCC 1A03514]|tara:strand:+ start:349 stop:4122 length:3774 start_codon:yes stop_codon:yes gene_type:complete